GPGPQEAVVGVVGTPSQRIGDADHGGHGAPGGTQHPGGDKLGEQSERGLGEGGGGGPKQEGEGLQLRVQRLLPAFVPARRARSASMPKRARRSRSERADS